MSDLSRSSDESVAKIEKLRSNLAEANDQALRDPLTGLGNRRFFDQKLDSALVEARADSGELCLMMCDLDRFKAINDKFGHPVGDMVLKMFGELLSNNITPRNTAVRVGGEEFAVIFPEARPADAAAVADQILKAARREEVGGEFERRRAGHRHRLLRRREFAQRRRGGRIVQARRRSALPGQVRGKEPRRRRVKGRREPQRGGRCAT